jgi:hypothetical protein
MLDLVLNKKKTSKVFNATALEPWNNNNDSNQPSLSLNPLSRLQNHHDDSSKRFD